ncbi:Protein CSN12-like protein [Diplonema papillatum]|nr:Protein CSN12-like protein [Diplonema papillatum]
MSGRGKRRGGGGRGTAGKGAGRGMGVLDALEKEGGNGAPPPFGGGMMRGGKGPRPAGAAAAGGGGALGNGVEGRLRAALAVHDVKPFVAFLTNNRSPGVLWRETGATSVETLAAKLSGWCQGEHRKLGSVLACCSFAMQEFDQNRLTSAHSAMQSAVSNFSGYLDDASPGRCEHPAWMLPMLSPLSSRARRIAMAWEGPQRSVRMDEVAAVLRKVFTQLASDRASSLETSKKLGMITICNELSRIAFCTNNMGVLKSVMGMLASQNEKVKKEFGVSLLEAVPVAERVTHKYYSGRFDMLEQKFQDAEQALSEAFACCNTSYHKNMIRILIFLVTVKLVQGKFPAGPLLEDYGLTSIFQPITDAMKNCNVAQFDQAMEQNASLFAKLGIYVILHRARIVCFLTLIRRVHKALCLIEPNDPNFQTRIKQWMLTEALVLANEGAEVNPEEIECAVVCLIAGGQVKGYISRSLKTVVLSKKMQFPTIGE